MNPVIILLIIAVLAVFSYLVTGGINTKEKWGKYRKSFEGKTCCFRCIYWEDLWTDGDCHRFPEKIRKNRDDFCKDFNEVNKKEWEKR